MASDCGGHPEAITDADTGKWAVIAMGGLTLLYVLMRPSLKKKDPLEKPSGFAALSQQRAVEKQMTDLLVELSEMARQITAITS